MNKNRTYNVKFINITKSPICRICLKHGNIPIFGDNNHEDLQANLQKITGIKVHINDKFPKNLCSCCYSLLESALLLHNLVKETNETLCKCTKININNSLFVYLRDSIENNKVHKMSDKTENTKKKLENNTKQTSTMNTIEKKTSTIIDKDSHILEEVNQEVIDSSQAIHPSSCTKIKPKQENTSIIQIQGNSQELVLNPSNKNKVSNNEVTNKNKESQENTQTQDNFNTLLVTYKTNQYQPVKVAEDSSTTIEDNYPTSVVKVQEIDTTQETKNIKVAFRIVKPNVCYVDKKSFLLSDYTQYSLKSDSLGVIEESKDIDKESSTNKHNSNALNEKKDTVKCPICFLVCERYKFNKHFYSHPEPSDMKLKCTICGRLYKKSYYDKHIHYHFYEKICDYCGKVFLTNTCLRRHYVKHTQIFPYKCPLCPYRGKSKYHMKNHIYFHTKDRRVECAICGKIISSYNNFKKHLLMHQGKRDFTCETCKRGFYSKPDLRSHINSVHLGLKEFVCEVCSAPFSTKSKLRTHERDVHKRAIIPPGGPHYLKAYKSQEPQNLN